MPEGRITLPAMTDESGTAVTIPKPGAKATALLFVAVDCPIANRYVPELRRIQQEFEPKSIAFYRVYVDADLTPGMMKKHAAEFEFTWPAIHDKKHQLVHSVLASVTPEAAVIGPDGTLLYRGRVNDLYLEHGNWRTAPTRHDLREALGEILAGKPVTVRAAPSIGCWIPDLVEPEKN